MVALTPASLESRQGKNSFEDVVSERIQKTQFKREKKEEINEM